MKKLLVVSRYNAASWNIIDSVDGTKLPEISSVETRNDGFDDFNHPRIRRACILHRLDEMLQSRVSFQVPSGGAAADLSMLADNDVCDASLVEFLSTAWDRWDRLGTAGQDPASSLHWLESEEEDSDNGSDHDNTNDRGSSSNENDGGAASQSKRRSKSKPLIPGNTPLPRDPFQRPSQGVMGQMGYYCTDTFTPVFRELKEELLWDAATIQAAVEGAIASASSDAGDVGDDPNEMSSLMFRGVYALCTHPGHHAAYQSFGGYCYVNNAALAARLLQKKLATNNGSTDGSTNSEDEKKCRVAIIDVDYHCGNGTASIFYRDASILMVSIHCHPDHEYPFHSGFADQTGADEGVGATMHIPLMPGAAWSTTYEAALQLALDKALNEFEAQGLILSLGLDTYNQDPCSTRRAGFALEGRDYHELGKCVAVAVTKAMQERQSRGSEDGSDNDNDNHNTNQSSIPVIWTQEGGYFMEKVPQAVGDLFDGFLSC